MVPSGLVLRNLEPCTKIRTLGAQQASLSGSKQQTAGNELVLTDHCQTAGNELVLNISAENEAIVLNRSLPKVACYQSLTK